MLKDLTVQISLWNTTICSMQIDMLEHLSTKTRTKGQQVPELSQSQSTPDRDQKMHGNISVTHASQCLLGDAATTEEATNPMAYLSVPKLAYLPSRMDKEARPGRAEKASDDRSSSP